MNAIQIRTRLESDSPHLPELKPFIGRNVMITVVEEEPGILFTPGHGDWDAAFAAVDEMIKRGTYDFDALREQDEYELKHAEDHLQ